MLNVKDLKAYYHSGPEDDEASHLVKERISVGVLMHHKQKRPPRCGVTSAQTQAASEQGGQLSIICQGTTIQYEPLFIHATLIKSKIKHNIPTKKHQSYKMHSDYESL